MIKSTGWGIVRGIFAVLFVIFMLTPMVVIIIASLTNDGYVQFPPSTYGFRWYFEIFRNQTLINGLFFSLEVGVAVAIAAGLFGVAAAVAITRSNFVGKNAIVGFLTMPLAIPHVVLALALLQALAVVRIATAPWGLIAGHVLITTPYVLRLTLTSLHDLDHLVERASYSLGASPMQTFRLVTLPMIAPGVVAGVFFAFLLSFDEVTMSIFFAVPGKTTLPAQIFAIAATGSDPIITAASGLLIVVSMGIVLFTEKYFGALRLIVGGRA
jgi:putative spermidine/putrescine transport system permease protein